MKIISYFLLFISFTSSIFAAELRTIYSNLLSEEEKTSQYLSQELSLISKDKELFRAKLEKMRVEVKLLEIESKSLNKVLVQLNSKKKKLKQSVTSQSKNSSGLKSVLATSNADLKQLLKEYPVFNADKKLDEKNQTFNIKSIIVSYHQFIKESSEVGLKKLDIAAFDGIIKPTEVLYLGAFGNLYHENGNYGYLDISNNTIKRARHVPKKTQNTLIQYFKGKTDIVGLDFSKGDILKQWNNSLTFKKQLRKGGVLIIPIILVAFFGFLLVLERCFNLFFRGIGDEKTFGEIVQAAANGDWETTNINAAYIKESPLKRIAEPIISSRDLSEHMRASVLEEVLLREVPRIERNLSLLSATAAVSPMLGLLGTVTGMIGTFHAITMYGAGDPKMMAGGISEALTTTMLGLVIAIPLMLAHSFFSRKSEVRMDKLQEMGMRLYNAIEIGYKNV